MRSAAGDGSSRSSRQLSQLSSSALEGLSGWERSIGFPGLVGDQLGLPFTTLHYFFLENVRHNHWNPWDMRGLGALVGVCCGLVEHYDKHDVASQIEHAHIHATKYFSTRDINVQTRPKIIPALLAVLVDHSAWSRFLRRRARNNFQGHFGWCPVQIRARHFWSTPPASERCEVSPG